MDYEKDERDMPDRPKMNRVILQELLHDINAVFDSVVYEVCSTTDDWVEVHLAEGVNITACDFPHLLTIARGYNVLINIFVVKLNQLGIFFKEMK